MKPLPAQKASSGQISGGDIPSLPHAFTTPVGLHSIANRRTAPSPLQHAYPWLLITSTAIAALFCLMYITKPVIQSSLTPPVSPSVPAVPAVPAAPAAPAAKTSTQAALMPNGNRLPGEQNTAPTDLKPTAPNPSGATPDSPSTSAFEETNLKIQHILTAEIPAGQLARIDVEVPVLYQSRNLRWTPEDVAEARQLLARLTDYQDKSQQLRASATNLLDAWNRLISRSLPASELRADSPSLPSNQKDAANAPLSSGLITTESIQIQPAEK